MRPTHIAICSLYFLYSSDRQTFPLLDTAIILHLANQPSFIRCRDLPSLYKLQHLFLAPIIHCLFQFFPLQYFPFKRFCSFHFCYCYTLPSSALILFHFHYPISNVKSSFLKKIELFFNIEENCRLVKCMRDNLF